MFIPCFVGADQKAWGAPNSLILEQEDDEDAQMQRAVQVDL